MDVGERTASSVWSTRSHAYNLYDEPKLVLWFMINSCKSVVIQKCYRAVSRSREFDSMTCKLISMMVVISRQCTVCEIREKVFTNIYFVALLLQTRPIA